MGYRYAFCHKQIVVTLFVELMKYSLYIMLFLSQFKIVCVFFVSGCRSVEAGEKVRKVIKSHGAVSGEVTCFQLDVGSFKSIKTFAELVLKRFPQIDLLVNNGLYVFFT